MAYNQNFKSQVLKQEKEQNQMKNKIEKIQTEYKKYENGEINSGKLITALTEMDIPINPKIEYILKSPNLDNKNFRNFLKNLEVAKDNKTESRQASAQLKQHNYNTKQNQENIKKLKDSKFLT